MADTFFPELPPRDSSESWPSAESGYDEKVRYWLEAAYDEAKGDLDSNDIISQVSKYIRYFEGRQWDRKRASYKSSPVDNRIWRLMWELISIMTDIRPIFEVKSSKEEYTKQAGMINKATRSWWLNSDADMNLAMIIMYSILTTGYGKLTWNDELRNGQGDLELMPLGPSDVLPLKPRHSLQSSQAVIYETVQPLGWFRKKFGSRGTLVQPDMGISRFSVEAGRPSHLPSAVYDNLSPQMKQMIGNKNSVQGSTYPQAKYREYWIKDWSYNVSNRTVSMGRPKSNWCYDVPPGKPLYPRGRLLCMGGRVVCYDGPSPYWHGQFPFDVLRMNVVPWSFLGLSDMAPLLPLQDIVNNIFAGVMDMIKKAVNPAFYGPKNAFSESMWDSLDWSMPGIKAGYSPMVTQKPEFAPPVILPSFVLQFLQVASREMDQSSGLAAITEALKKKQVPAGETLDKIKDAQQTPLRLKGRNIEVFLRNLGTQNISNIFQFYTAERRMTMLGRDGLTFEDFDWDPGTMVPAGMSPEDHARSFTFNIEPGTLLNANRVEEAMLFARLRMQGDMDRKTFFKKLDIGVDVDQIEAGLKREVQEGVSLHPPKPQKGGGGQPKAA